MIKIQTTITVGLMQIFTGISHSHFQRLANRLAPLWEESEHKRLLSKDRIRSIRTGSQYKLKTIEAKLFFYLLYCRHYVNQRVIAGLCGLNQSNISRLFERMEKLISQAADPQLNTFLETIKHKREAEGLSFAELKMLYPEIEKVITDVTEIRCNRPKNKERRKNNIHLKSKSASQKTSV